MGREYNSTAGKTISSAMKKWLYKWNGLYRLYKWNGLYRLYKWNGLYRLYKWNGIYRRNNLVAFYYPNASDI